jgi:RNA polymerase sigma-70 factor (ECF subfamily)
MGTKRMAEAPVTRPSLLVRMRDPQDTGAWSQFVEIYAPLVYGFARKKGLQDADAADVTQNVLRRVSGGAAKLEYDPGKGSFRGWLFTIARRQLSNFFAGRTRQNPGTGDTAVHELLADQPAPGEQARWDDEYEQRLFAWAAAQSRKDFEASTWQAFWQTAVEGKAAKDVAAVLGLTVGAVYIGKSRVMARLREYIRQV